MAAKASATRRETRRLEVAESRELAVGLPELSEVLNDPARYQLWIPTLRTMEARPDGTWLARLSYLGFRRTIVFTQITGGDDAVAWRGSDSEVEVEVTATVTPRAPNRVLVRFRGSVESADGLLGLAVDHTLLRVSLSHAVIHSLACLEELVLSSTHKGDREEPLSELAPVVAIL
jgi:hypothetical protein